MNLSPNFTLAEATKSATAIRLGIDNSAPEEIIPALQMTAGMILEPVRVHFETPFSPSSWYRSPALNHALGSSDTSQHIKGEAVDFEVPGIPNLKLARWIADNLSFDQAILEHWSPDDPAAGWVHCSHAFDGNNRGELLTYFGKGRYENGFPV